MTNDFPPRPGGIQTVVQALCRGLRDRGHDLVVLTSSWRGAAAFDAAQDFEVVRIPGTVLLPGPDTARRARELVRARGCRAVLFGAAAPLGLLARSLRAAGVERAVGITHGHETGWARLPGARTVLRRIAGDLDALTYGSAYCGEVLAAALPEAAAAGRLVPLRPGVDPVTYRPDAGGDAVRARLGLAGRPVVVCVSRLVPRKGQDRLVLAWPEVRRRVPGARLLLVGGGPDRHRLRRLAARGGVADAVQLTGTVPAAELPAYYGAGDVFAMPARTRGRGLDVEALGVVSLEAAACGLPVVVGASGGSPEGVRHGETGWVVDGRSTADVVRRLVALLRDPVAARAMGARGRDHVVRHRGWTAAVTGLDALLAPGAARPDAAQPE